MSLLLDTHILLWAAYAPERLSGAAREVLEDEGRALWVSVVSLWEVTIKRALERSDFDVDPVALRAGYLRGGYRELEIAGRHCLALADLPGLHRDPFDRMLLAQAGAEGLTLMTADAQVAAYGGPVLRV